MKTIHTNRLTGRRTVEDDFGTLLASVHPSYTCLGQYCAIDNPSKHPLSEAPQLWRVDRGILERICSHGVGHPDPDSKYEHALDRIHGCDGCCMPGGAVAGASGLGKTNTASRQQQQSEGQVDSRTYEVFRLCLNCDSKGWIGVVRFGVRPLRRVMCPDCGLPEGFKSSYFFQRPTVKYRKVVE